MRAHTQATCLEPVYTPQPSHPHPPPSHLRVRLAWMTLYIPKPNSATVPTAITSEDGPCFGKLRL